MIIRNIKRLISGENITASAEIQFNGSKSETMFFIIPKKFHSFLSPDASPYLAALLIPCMKTGEDITIEGTISDKLNSSIPKIMNLLISWKKGFSKINIHASRIRRDDEYYGNIGCFFSAGVDSFYTYLKHKKKRKGKVTHLIFVQGFDIDLQSGKLFDVTRKHIEQIADNEKIAYITVKTNVASITDPRLIWDWGHGGALASIALLLRKGFKSVYIAGSVATKHLFPYGTHPDLDKLWSTEYMTIIHDGIERDRLDKIVSIVSRSPLALSHLRVCCQNLKGYYNCSSCYKCLRTMISLKCCGVLDRCNTFDKKIDLEKVKNMHYDYRFSQNISGEETLLFLRDHKLFPDLQNAIEYSLAKSRHPDLKNRLIAFLAMIDQKYFNRKIYSGVFRLTRDQDRNVLFKLLSNLGLIR